MKKNDILLLGAGAAALWWLLRPKSANASVRNKISQTLVPSRITTFGGSTDSIESLHGVAGLPAKKPTESPAQYFARVPKWVRGHLNGAMANLSFWPEVEGRNWKTGEKKSGPAGISYFLEPSSYYAAWRYPSDWAPLVRAGRVILEGSVNGNQWIPIARVIDWGPAFPDVLDVSRVAKRKIEDEGYKIFRIRETEKVL